MTKINYWTTDEVLTLKQYYATSTREEILRILPGRTKDSIKQMAKNLNLKKSSRECLPIEVDADTRTTHSGTLTTYGNKTIHRMR